ncbi:serine hydrolase domain-containing protein [Epilithonimonas caeni]|uniref:serine hydrolase domain-containing protein n=1 Tax=Epilithonimonas caeni TaxID=365343 RepID=UPI000428C266|nr:serine hydrolase domain-containing protein [Epilithonimonas caeni]
MKKELKIMLMFLLSFNVKAQVFSDKIDSVRTQYKIPALGVAVLSSDSILEMNVYGTNKINSDSKITLKNRFHIGSNTKAVTSFIAADLVSKGKINWDTEFFSLFPELKTTQNEADFTLIELLNFKTPLTSFSYDTEIPESLKITGTNQEQRYKIAKYLLGKKSVDKNEDNLYLTNLGYVLAGLMLEKASHKSYNLLVDELGKNLGIIFQFGSPSLKDKMQTYGHDSQLNPINTENIKLNWLLTAGNLNISLPDYSLFIQNYLLGIKGKGKMLKQDVFDKLLFGFPKFSFGWFNMTNDKGKSFIRNFGNANGFMSSVTIMKEKNLAVIILGNVSSDLAQEGIEKVFEILEKKYYR